MRRIVQLFLLAGMIAFSVLAPAMVRAQVATAENAGDIQTFPEGKINWTRGEIRAIGIGVPPPNMSPAMGKVLAREAAITIAERNLAKIIYGIHIISETTVKNLTIESDIIRENVEGLIKGHTVIREKSMPDGSYEVVVAIPLYGKGSVASSINLYDQIDQTFAPPETKPPTVPEATPPVIPEPKPPVVPETKPPVIPETKPPVVPETKPPVVPETKPPVVPETKPPVVPETKPPVVPETKPPVVPETKPPVVPEATPPVVPGTKPPIVPEVTPPVVPETKPPATPVVTPPVVPEVKPPVTPDPEPPTAPKPTTAPETKPATKPDVKPATAPAPKPDVKPATKPETKPVTKPVTPIIAQKPATKPVTPIIDPKPATNMAPPEQPIKPDIKPPVVSVVHTGVIVDCRGMPFTRSMCPRVWDEMGKDMWLDINVTAEEVNERGVATYYTSLEDAQADKARLGNNPLILRAINTAGGRVKTIAVVTNADMIRIHAFDAKSHFLKALAVGFIMD